MLKKIEEGELEALIVDEEFFGRNTLTICALTLSSGFRVVGTSACMNPDDYDQAIGEDLARRKAFDQLWQLEGYHRMRLAETTGD